VLEERSVISQITVLEYGNIQVQRADVILRDGVEITRAFHRHVVIPGQDLTREDERVRDIAVVVHTPEVIRNYNDHARPTSR